LFSANTAYPAPETPILELEVLAKQRLNGFSDPDGDLELRQIHLR
jgi:hypothetical protein